MKKIFIIAGMLSAGVFYAQQDGSVGINTQPSGATLDVQISADAVKTEGQGIAVPRVTKQQLSEMNGTIAEGALVYVNEIGTATGPATGRIADVTDANGVGFYYFNGKSSNTSSKWVKVGGGASSASSVAPWQDVRTAEANIFTSTEDDQVIPDNAWFVISNYTKIRLPKMEEGKNVGKMIIIFKQGANNTTVTDFDGKAANTAESQVLGTTTVTSARGKSYIWTGKNWYPAGY